MVNDNNTRKTWTKLAQELDNMDVRTLKKNCAKIMRRLNKMKKLNHAQKLTPPQIELIKKHLGYL